MRHLGYQWQVALCGVLALSNVPYSGAADSQLGLPPGFTSARTGGSHDFDYLVGAWTTQQRRLKSRDVGSSEWLEPPANRHCAVSYLDGRAIVEESRFPSKEPAGLFFYTFSPQTRQWSIYWLNGKTGQVDPPLVGGFAAGRGEFYAEDVDNGRPIKVRVTWTVADHNHARWEQAFSYDNRTWETNWISDFTRGDPATICSAPVPGG
ncbi:MAG TPA: hypothetical protein VNX02_14580 [Steroidobacteraceae bacterium]|jgi:hypothetical protein|nr:hypothetical protein [Steroidobacteraceae bacterium]